MNNNKYHINIGSCDELEQLIDILNEIRNNYDKGDLHLKSDGEKMIVTDNYGDIVATISF